MADLPPSQKRISESYTGNLGYFLRPHYFRSMRLWSFILVATLSVAGVLTFRQWGSQRAFTTGPESANHAHFASNCQACHTGSQLKPADLLLPIHLAGMLSRASLAGLDKACLECHPAMGLHTPQNTAIAHGMLSNHEEPVRAASCATCHREHAGPQRMALPSNQSCTDCHSNPDKLHQSSPRPDTLSVAESSPRGTNRILGDGLVRFIAPSRSAAALPAFESFAQGHPDFGYQSPGIRDPANLKFSHARHVRPDLPLIDNKKLDCTSCHQPEPNGAFYQPVSFNKHCQQCHSLHIQQNLPTLLIPHGDPAKVRFFLASLDASFEETFRSMGISSPIDISERLQTEKLALRNRGIHSLQDLEKRVFFEGDPQDTERTRGMRAGNFKFLTECVKCHYVTAGTGISGPKIPAPGMAQRWLQKGAFTHLPHQNVLCTDCHGAALQSKLTTDVLLPPRKLCAECHRAPDGVKSDCQSCHFFHSSVKPSSSSGLLGVPHALPSKALNSP